MFIPLFCYEEIYKYNLKNKLITEFIDEVRNTVSKCCRVHVCFILSEIWMKL